MKPVMQTKRGGEDVPPEERGDCLSAAIASILEVAIEDVPIPHSDHEEYHWWDATQEALAIHGYIAVIADTGFVIGGWWLAGVPSLNLRKPNGAPLPHMVVMHEGKVAHDPSLGQRYEVGTPVEDLILLDAYVLAPLSYGENSHD